MGWKYVMFENWIGDTVVKFPVIFPDKMVHSDVYAHLKVIMPGWESKGVHACSAGKIEHLIVEGLGGGSETLNIKSDPGDQGTIEAYSYVHGLA